MRIPEAGEGPVCVVGVTILRSPYTQQQPTHRMANMPASVQTERSSAPVVLGQSRAITSNRMSRSTFMAWMFFGGVVRVSHVVG